MLPPPLTSQPCCQQLLGWKVTPNPGWMEELGSPGLWGGRARQQDRQKRWRASPDTPSLSIPHVALLPCPVYPWWDKMDEGHHRAVLPPAWLASPTPGEPGLLCCSGTQVSWLAAPAPATEPKTSLESFLQHPTRARSHQTFVRRPTEAGKRALLLRGWEYRKIITQALRRPPSPDLQPRWLSWVPMAKGHLQGARLFMGIVQGQTQQMGQLSHGLLLQGSSAGPAFGLTE